jgi:RND superfamily putative drug exporter
LKMLQDQIVSLTPESGNPAAFLGMDAGSTFNLLAQYLTELGQVFPWVQEESSYQAIGKTTQELSQALAQMNEATLVENQLRNLSSQVGALAQSGIDPQAVLGQDLGQPLVIIQGYLLELGEEYAVVKSEPSYQQALNTLTEIQVFLGQIGGGQQLAPDQIQAALAQLESVLPGLSENLSTLGDTFVGREDARLFPLSLAQSSESIALQMGLQELLATFVGQLEDLGSQFRERGDPYFLPQNLLAAMPEAQGLLDVFFSPERDATRLYVALSSYPYSLEAFETVRQVRSALNTALANTSLKGGEAVIGGATAELADVQQVVDEDFNLIMAVLLAGIFIVLALLLRSLVAPLYLLGTVLLSYGTTLGIVTWLYNGVLGCDGLNYIVPIILLVLLVALGSDYNIFLTSRIREEWKSNPSREGIRVAATTTGGIITACGIILAGTFAALTSAPIQTLSQVGAALAIGVLVDTFLVRALLVPAIAAMLGRWNWWPMRHIGQ